MKFGWLGAIAVAVLAVFPQGSRSYRYEDIQKNHGNSYCRQYDNPLVGACTSGAYGDCAGSNSAIIHCDDISGVLSSSNSGGSWNWEARHGFTISCSSTQIGQGFCVSGTYMDCLSATKTHGIYCRDMAPGTKRGTSLTKSCKKGENCKCDSGYFMTGLCASGRDADCDSSAGIYTKVECSPIQCDAGYEMYGGACRQCSPGWHSTMSGQMCMKCPAAKYSSSWGSTSCSSCEAGWVAAEGSSACKWCGFGEEPNYSKDGCTQCSAGKYTPTAQSKCENCPPGRYATVGWPRDTCGICPKGTTVKVDQTGCDDVKECKEDNGGCPENSKCMELVKNEMSADGDRGFNCRCNSGFAVQGTFGMTVQGDEFITCEVLPTKITVTSITSSSVSIQVSSTLDTQYIPKSLDLDVSRFVTRRDTESITGGHVTYLTSQLMNGVTTINLDPGTPYLFKLQGEKAKPEEPGINEQKVITTCECTDGVSDQPGSFHVKQQRGLVMFEFSDQSKCEEGYIFGRTGAAGIREVFTSTYYYTSSEQCGEELKPGDQVVDKLLLSQLPVGSNQKYCVQAVAAEKAGYQYSSEESCQDFLIAWEASIDGTVTLAPNAGSLPVEGAVVSWQVMSSEGQAIEALSGTLTTDRTGKYQIQLISTDSDLYTPMEGENKGRNRDVEVRIWFSKATGTMSHKFMCDDGEFVCSGEGYASVYLRHLDFDVRHTAVDTSSVPITGKVVIEGTGPPLFKTATKNTPEYYEVDVKASKECPISNAEVCLQVMNNSGGTSQEQCVKTDAEGSFEIGAPISTTVKVVVRYNNHKFVLHHSTYNVLNEDGGFLIDPLTAYEGFIFKDVEMTALQTHVVGGLCNRKLGDAQIVVSLPSCPYWRGQPYKQPAIKGEHYVIAQMVEVEATIKGRENDIQMSSQVINLQEVPSNEAREQMENRTMAGNLEGEGAGLQDESTMEDGGTQIEGDQKELALLRFQYDGSIVVSAAVTGDMATKECANQADTDTSFHILPAYKNFVLSVFIEQYFGEGIENCDHIPEDTKIYIQSGIGVGDNPSDKNFLEQMPDKSVEAQYKKCSAQTENNECTYPDCCLLDIQHTELADGTKTRASIVEEFRAGPPFIADPFTKDIIIKVEETSHTATILVVGDYDDGVPDRYPLPAMDPIMILRDPPGGSSYAFYENVKTTTTVEFEGYDKYEGFAFGYETEVGFGTKGAACAGTAAGAAFFKCVDDVTVKAKLKNSFEHTDTWNTEHEEDTKETTFVTTWSYQTSAESDSVGHNADIFVVPSMSLLLHMVYEVALPDKGSCEGKMSRKVKFSAESKKEENSLAFLTLKELKEYTIKELGETETAVIAIKNDSTETAERRKTAEDVLLKVTQALKNWNTIIQDYEKVNAFDSKSALINPSEWLKTMKPAPDKSLLSHWSSLIPAGLSDAVKKEVGLEEWEDVKLVTFSGGGSELSYQLDKSFYKDFGYMVGEKGDNTEDSNTMVLGFLLEATFFGADNNFVGILPSYFNSNVRVHFKNDNSGDDTSVGFVLSDPDDGDRFDVQIGLDPKYGSFVFKTIAGLSKCPFEEGTTQRELPKIQLLSMPTGEILPDSPAVFQVRLGNEGITSNEYDLTMELNDNDQGLEVYANGAALVAGQNYELDAFSSVETTISIFRGPVLYEYNPIHLKLQSTCDDDVAASFKIHTHTQGDAKELYQVIRYARECPRISMAGSLKTGLFVVNKKTAEAQNVKTPGYVPVPVVIQNVDRDVIGTLSSMRDNPDDTLEEVQLLYRKLGTTEWDHALAPDPDDSRTMVNVDLIDFGQEDDFGFVSAEWNVNALADGTYEVMVKSYCPDNHVEFSEATTAISTVVLDRINPELYMFPSETDVLNVGEPMIFEWDEALDCTLPYTFKFDIKVTGVNRVFDNKNDNVLVVCEDRMIGLQFDGSRFDLKELQGKAATVELFDVTDTSGNFADRIKVNVKFNKALVAPGGKARRLDSVPSIKVFRKERDELKMDKLGILRGMIQDNARREEAVLQDKFEELAEMEQGKEEELKEDLKVYFEELEKMEKEKLETMELGLMAIVMLLFVGVFMCFMLYFGRTRRE